MLPHALVWLLDAALVSAQTRQQLSLNSLSSFTPQSLPNPPAFSLPSSDVLAVSVAVCSGDSQSSLLRFFVTNDTSVGIPGSGGGKNVFEIVLDAGLGNWTGLASNGGVLAVENVDQTSFEVGTSSSGELFVSLGPSLFFKMCFQHLRVLAVTEKVTSFGRDLHPNTTQ
jgi:calcium channel MID1